MKKLLFAILTVATLVCATIPAKAQVTTQPAVHVEQARENLATPQALENPPALPNDSGFLSTVTGYFGSFNPALATTWTNHSGQFWTAAEFTQGAHAGTQAGLSYQVYNGISVEGTLHLRDISGTISGLQLGVGYSVHIVDVQVTGYAAGGYDQYLDKPYAEIGVRFQKALTEHTYAFVGAAGRIESKSAPIFTIGAGFVF